MNILEEISSQITYLTHPLQPTLSGVPIHFPIQPSSSITLFNVYHECGEKKAEKYTFQPFRRRNHMVPKFSLFIYASTKNHKIQLTALNRIQNSVTTFQSPFDLREKRLNLHSIFCCFFFFFFSFVCVILFLTPLYH